MFLWYGDFCNSFKKVEGFPCYNWRKFSHALYNTTCDMYILLALSVLFARALMWVTVPSVCRIRHYHYFYLLVTIKPMLYLKYTWHDKNLNHVICIHFKLCFIKIPNLNILLLLSCWKDPPYTLSCFYLILGTENWLLISKG